MSDREERRNLYAGTLGHDNAAVRKRIAEIRNWGARNDRPFVEDLLNANPRLEWGIPEVGRDPIPEDFELAFGLTRVEAEIAAAFASGHKLTACRDARLQHQHGAHAFHPHQGQARQDQADRCCAS